MSSSRVSISARRLLRNTRPFSTSLREEARNMGAWSYVNQMLPGLLRGTFPWSCISRPVSASPATGSASRHKLEQERLVRDALGREAKS